MGESSCGGHYGVGVGVGGSLLYSLYYYYKLVLTKRRVEMVNETPRNARERERERWPGNELIDLGLEV